MQKTISYALLFMILTISCTNPFSARESEPPSENEGTYITPVEPQLVLVNLEASYNEKIITNYMQCLDTLFAYRYDFLQFQGPDSGWGYNSEISLTDKIFAAFRSSSESISLSLSLAPIESLPDLEDDTTATIHREYELISISDIDIAMPDTTFYRGTASFELIETGVNLWRLRRWTDNHASPNDTAWSDFKNGYR